MQAPKLPSFFKAPNAKLFSFKPRYYDQNKERREQLINQGTSPLQFKSNKVTRSAQKVENIEFYF